MRRWLLLAALLLSACATRPVGRLYPQESATYVELLNANAPEVWLRLHEALAKYDVHIQKEVFENGEGYILCEPFTADVPGSLNTSDYQPGEIVIAPEGETVALFHAMEFYLSASPTGLVRVWSDANISVSGYRSDSIRTPNLVGHSILDETVKPFSVVKQWRTDRPKKQTAK